MQHRNKATEITGALRRRSNVVGIPTRLWARWSGTRIPSVAGDFLVSKTSRTVMRPSKPPNSMVTGKFSRR